MRWLLIFAFALVCYAQDSLPPDLLLLAKIKVRVAENMSRLPNYTCTQTIDRTRREDHRRAFQPLDTVRLEVALVEGKELYGWPGANRIDESELGSLVGGTIGNGNFALLAKSIFLSSAALFHYVGQQERAGRKSFQYDFRVPRLQSGYHLHVPPHEAIVGYHGWFQVDAQSLDLVRIELSLDEIPPLLGVERSGMSMDYARAQIGGADFLLPSASELAMTDINGIENRNQSRFHNCRQYAGESKLTFSDPQPEGPAPVKAAVVDIALPKEVVAEISLVDPIDSATSAVGDPVRARLEHNLKEHGRIVVPKGALLSGRIARLQRDRRAYWLGIAFDSIEFEGGRASMASRVSELVPLLSRQSGGSPVLSYASPDPEPKEYKLMRLETDHVKMRAGSRLILRSLARIRSE